MCPIHYRTFNNPPIYAEFPNAEESLIKAASERNLLVKLVEPGKSDSISQATITIGKILSVLTPKAGLLTLDATSISSDPEVVTAYANDPLVFHGKTPARLAAELLKAMVRVTAETDRIALPFIVVQGGEDKLVDPAGAQLLYDRASSKDKTIKVYKGLYH
jgi:acylglycerol lipase